MHKNLRRDLRLFKAFSLGNTCVLFALSVATCRPAEVTRAAFEQVDVERLNIVESDGRIRMVLANSSRQADTVIDGKVIAAGRDRPAGMIFFNEEGSEVGGLVFTGRKKDGVTEAAGSLTFDRYNQDQTVQVEYSEHGSQYRAGLRVIDRPATSLATVADLSAKREAAQSPAERAEIEREMMAKMGIASERTFVGRSHDGNAAIVLSDASSRPRLVLSVAPDGTAKVQFLDERARITREIVP